MKQPHLTEEEVQQYAADSTQCDAVISRHVQLCKNCAGRVANYHLLISGIKEQPESAFDFDLPELVLTKLPQPKPRQQKDSFGVYGLIAAGVGIVSIVLFYLQQPGITVFPGVSSLPGYLIITSVCTLLAVLVIDMYIQYRKKMNLLNY